MSSKLADLYYLGSSIHSDTKEAVLEASEWNFDICSWRTEHVDKIGHGYLFTFLVGLFQTR